ncbi:mas-related G-protein coupled receptor member H-like [Crotalus tigris]|uniref:mas-related G-protein coupled receptor member H-like n=1 Tax=Crotalus tigris TaxID=88082 RepID=UPI00192F4017|nr:mas-related G-protein coupled receptor member H-like [Crotalus tigris]
MNSSLGDLDAAENHYGYNDANEHTEQLTLSDVEVILWTGIALITCCVGFVGNGYIIWLLGFQMKRNCFTTFIINLAVADFGFLTCVVIAFIYLFTNLLGSILNFICFSFTQIMYIDAHFLMTAISIDQCVAVLFPIWHRCSRPKHLSPAVCVILWTSSFLLAGTVNIMKFTKVIVNDRLFTLHLFVTAMVCLLLITLSTVVLFIKVCLKSNQKNQGRLLLMILITLLCFLILAFPLSIIVVIFSFSSTEAQKELRFLIFPSVMLSCLNSSINPMIYFLVGRKKGAWSKESMKVLLQNAFKEGEVARGR